LKKLILLLFIPVGLKAQVVQSVISNDYLNLIRNKKNSTDTLAKDTSYTIQQATATLAKYWQLSGNIKKAAIVNHQFKITENYNKRIELGITYSTALGIKSANAQPALQNTYVQGQSAAGGLKWLGAEYNEAFSYGPDIRTLSYDGSNYNYDSKGKLVTSTDGNTPATPYNNSILRSGLVFSQSLHTQIKLLKSYDNYWDFAILGNQSTENLILVNNKNSNQNISFTSRRKKK
jgi:hypothetical protein